MNLKYLGIGISIVGLILSSGGIVGEARLRQWDTCLRKWTRHIINFSRALGRRFILQALQVLSEIFAFVDSSQGCSEWFLIVALIIGTFLCGLLHEQFAPLWATLSSYSRKLLGHLPLICQFLMAYVIGGMFIGLIFVLGICALYVSLTAITLFIGSLPLLGSGLLWTILLPYNLLDRIVERARLQSTILLAGLVLNAIGLLLLELPK